MGFKKEEDSLVVRGSIELAEPAPQPEVAVFESAVKNRSSNARSILEKAAEIFCSIDAVREALTKDVRFVVDIDEQTKQALREGAVRFDVGKDGSIYAQLRAANGRYSDKLPIKEELVARGLNPLEVQSAIQTQALQEQIEEVVETLKEIGEGISDIKQGQRDDRFGLLQGGQALYLEAQEVTDPTMRKLLEAQALKSLSDACGQLGQGAKTDIRYLMEGGYKQKKTGQTAAIDEKIVALRAGIEGLNAAFAMKAAIYYAEGEDAAVFRVIDQYASFLATTVEPYAGKLAELDAVDRLPKGGFWKEKAKALESADKMKMLLEGEAECELYMLPEAREIPDGE